MSSQQPLGLSICGERKNRRVHTLVNVGSSPHIVGKTIISVRLRLFCGAHPHVCGEHTHTLSSGPSDTGSSPRMRGTQRRRRLWIRRAGLIPTYAGNTFKAFIFYLPSRAHPHVCGEHLGEGDTGGG